ncbi:MAG: TIGR03086 family protein [Phycicoccus sp.]|nr:TIGR03086 family protein [Phycicoccus sp.]
MTTPLFDLSIPERYRAAAAAFTDRVQGTTDWDVPTPVKEWHARDIVGHLAWLPGMIGGGSSVTFEPLPSADDDPVAAWAALNRQVQALLDDADTADLVYSSQFIGTKPVPEVVDQYFTSDVIFHTWDLSRATGQDDQLDEGFIAGAYAGMQQMGEMIRSSGQFGEQQPVPDDATVQEQFFAFIGRDPRWTPPA